MNVVNKRRRVVVLINDMSSSGGIQRVAVNLVRILGHRYDTRLLSVEPLRTPVFHDSNLELQSLGYALRYGGRLRYLLDLARIALRLRRYVVSHRIDTVLAIRYDWACIAAFSLPRSVVKIGCEHIAFEEAPRYWRLMRRLSYGRLDAVAGLWQADLPDLSRLAKKALVIPNTVEMAPLADAGRREKMILCVGHLIPRKGLDRLLWALRKPLRAHPDWQLVFVGGGETGCADWEYLDYLVILLKRLQLEGRVILFPATQHIDEWYRRASIYAMGSRQEGMPMVLIEAKAYGLPIVSFDCPKGPKEIVRHEIDGYLIPDDNYAFGEAVSALMEDKRLWQRMSEAATEDARARFSVESTSQQWFELVDSLHAERDSLLVPR